MGDKFSEARKTVWRCGVRGVGKCSFRFTPAPVGCGTGASYIAGFGLRPESGNQLDGINGIISLKFGAYDSCKF